MWGNYYGPMMGGWGIGMGIFGLIFTVLIIIVVISLIRAIAGRGAIHCGHITGQNGDSAIEILKERYAKSEINKEEFEQKMKDLKNI